MNVGQWTLQGFDNENGVTHTKLYDEQHGPKLVPAQV